MTARFGISIVAQRMVHVPTNYYNTPMLRMMSSKGALLWCLLNNFDT